MALIINNVGINGRNNRYDSCLVQGLLKEAGYSIVVDGRIGNRSIEAIKAFQQYRMRDSRHSGYIEPNGPTLTALEGYATRNYYTLKSSDIAIGQLVLPKLREIAAQFYYCSKGKVITITSGTRTSTEQASAMFTKLKLGENILQLYIDQHAAQEIVDKYHELKNTGNSDSEILLGMEQAINNQMNNRIYISKHLKAGAVDIRSKDLEQKTDLINIARQFNIIVLDEGTPPHLHLQF